MKSWKSRWKSELDERIPELKAEVLNAPIVTASISEKEKSPVKHEKTSIFSMIFGTNKGRAFAAALAAVIITACVGVGLLLRPDSKPQVSAFALEINPKAMFSVDEDGVVTNVIALTADADVILANDECVSTIVGRKSEDAARMFVDCAARLGYVDLAAEDAVKVTGCGVEPVAVAEAVKSYFMDKGSYVLVLTESASVQNFCDLGGILDCNTVEEAVEALKNKAVSFSKREVESLADADLAQLYEERFGDDGRRASVMQYFASCKQTVEKGRQDLLKIIEKNDEIESHGDNPNILFKDYWSVAMSSGDYTEKFALLMSQMDELLNNYKNEYGVEIDGVAHLQAIGSTLTSEIAGVIEVLTEKFDFETFITHLEGIVRMFEYVGKDIAAALEAPSTVEEYLNRAEQFFLCRYDEMADAYAEEYGKVRESISQSEYDRYINNVIEKYGSVEEYWQAKKNN